MRNGVYPAYGNVFERKKKPMGLQWVVELWASFKAQSIQLLGLGHGHE